MVARPPEPEARFSLPELHRRARLAGCYDIPAGVAPSGSRLRRSYCWVCLAPIRVNVDEWCGPCLCEGCDPERDPERRRRCGVQRGTVSEELRMWWSWDFTGGLLT